MNRSVHFFEGCFGIERETLRVDSKGRLAQTPHPFGDDEHITRDFCENQIELITPVCNSIDEAYDSLSELDKKAREVLEENGESIWLYSNPPYIGNENEIPIARFCGVHTSKRNYREVLERKYGKRLMLFSGIHFNFSFSKNLIDDLNTENEDFRSFRDRLYLRLYKHLMVHSWLMVLLTASSPYYDRSFDSDGQSGAVKSEYSSIRNSSRGYWNQFVPVLDHSDIQAFADSILFYVNKGMLYSASELYLPVRLKPRGVNSLEALIQGGVDHIELRMFDLDPLSPVGLDKMHLKFAHLLMLYLISLPDFEFTVELQEKAVSDHQNAALLSHDSELLKRADKVLSDMTAYFNDNENAINTIKYEQEKLKGDDLCSRLPIDKIYR